MGILAITVARLYIVVNMEWKYTKVFGIIAFVMDRENKVFFIQIYDTKNYILRFQVEVPFEPLYTIESEFFHTLELEKVLVGFLFALGREEPLPVDKVATLTSEARRFGNAITRFSPDVSFSFSVINSITNIFSLKG